MCIDTRVSRVQTAQLLSDIERAAKLHQPLPSMLAVAKLLLAADREVNEHALLPDVHSALPRLVEVASTIRSIQQCIDAYGGGDSGSSSFPFAALCCFASLTTQRAHVAVAAACSYVGAGKVAMSFPDFPAACSTARDGCVAALFVLRRLVEECRVLDDVSSIARTPPCVGVLQLCAHLSMYINVC